MSILSAPLVADLAAQLIKRLAPMRVPPALRFDEIDAATTEMSVPTRHGDVRATLYQPADHTPTTAIYVNFHAGGFVLGHYEQDDPWCRYLTASAQIAVLNVDYALAPAHRFPVPIEQAYDVLRWAVDTERPWQARRLCVGGQSAGGNIAAGVARLARDLGTPRVCLQVIHYAPLDLVTAGKDKAARARRARVTPWLSEIFDNAYIPSVEQRRDVLASPAWGENCRDLAGIAPAVVITCELDRLRDEGLRYADALRRADALMLHHDIPNVDHGYNLFDAATRSTTEDVYRLIAEHVRRAVGE